MRNRRNSGTRRAAALAATLACMVLAQAGSTRAQDVPPDIYGILPTGQRITPAGTQTPVNSLPIAAELSPDGSYLAVLQAGFETPSVIVLETASGETTSRVELPDAWLGMTFNPAGDRLFVSGGTRSSVWDLSFRNGELAVTREFPLPGECAGPCDSLIGDLRLGPDGRMLYALDVLRARAIVVNTQSGLVLGEMATGAAPYRARITPDGAHLLISHWGEASVGLYRIAERRLVERIPVGEHPTDLLFVSGQVRLPGGGSGTKADRSYHHRLFVVCSHSDNLWTFGVSEQNRYDLLDGRSVVPLPESPLGSLPSALGVSLDGETLFAANAGNNVILVSDIVEALPESVGVIPTGWFPTAVVGLPDGGLAYLSGKGDRENAGLVSTLPAMTSEQLEFLTSAAVANLAGPVAGIPASPPRANAVVLILTDAKGPAWQAIADHSTRLTGYRPPSRSRLGRLAWMTSGMETDLFAKLGPAVDAGRLSERALASAGRAARPAAGTLWSNAKDASVPVEAYGIGGGRPTEALLAKLEAGSDPARLTVVRLTGTDTEQDDVLGALLAAWNGHPSYRSTVLFVVPTAASGIPVVTGGLTASNTVHDGFVSAPSLLRTIEWLLDLRPMTQFDASAPVLNTLFRTSR